jgi:hypothetical protein
MLPTIGCLVIAWIVKQNVGAADKAHFLSADAAMLSLILLFRALKELTSAALPASDKQKRPRAGAITWSLIWACGVALGTFATAYSWRLPLPNYFITQISAPDPRPAANPG